MNTREYVYLQAEKSAVKRLLDDVPVGNVLERSGLQARLEEVEQELHATYPPGREPARARLTFRGRPVIGNHGIFAEFGTKATGLFIDAVAKFAAALSGPLAAMGPIPNRSDAQLLITNTALGSFGFVLEEYRPGALDFGDESPASQALQMTRSLLESTLGTDDELADSAAGTDPRAIEAVRAFLNLLAASEAPCTLECNNRFVQFKDVGDVRRAADRLSQDNLHEVETTLYGEFQGVLPKGRTFEFKLAEGDEVIRGKVGSAIGDPDTINQHLHKPVEINVLATRVGNGRPRYMLTALPPWP